MDEEPTPAQGWYADPQDGSYLRWWDGEAWTGHTQAYPLEAASTVAGSTAEADMTTTATAADADGAKAQGDAASASPGVTREAGDVAGEFMPAAEAPEKPAGGQSVAGQSEGAERPSDSDAEAIGLASDEATAGEPDHLGDAGGVAASAVDSPAAPQDFPGFGPQPVATTGTAGPGDTGPGSDPTSEAPESADHGATPGLADEELQTPGLVSPQVSPTAMGAQDEPGQPGQPDQQGQPFQPGQQQPFQPGQQQPPFQPGQQQPPFQPGQQQPPFQPGQPESSGPPPTTSGFPDPAGQPGEPTLGQPAGMQGFPATPQGAFGSSPQGQGGYLGTAGAGAGFGDTTVNPTVGAPPGQYSGQPDSGAPPGAPPQGSDPSKPVPPQGVPGGYGQPAAYAVPGQPPAGSTGYSPMGPGAAFGAGAAAGAAAGAFGGQPGQGQPPTGADQPGFGQPPGAYGERPSGFGDPAGYGQAPGAYGYQDPYGQNPAGQDPYGQDPYAQDPYGQDPYGQYTQAGDIDVEEQKPKRNRLLLIILLGLLGLLVVAGLVWALFFRGSDTPNANPTPTGGPSGSSTSSAGTSAACESLAATLTDQDQTTEISVKLQELAKNVNASQNTQYFTDLQKTVGPTKSEFSQQCLADVNAGKAPKSYQTYLQSFDRAVSSGVTIGGQIVTAKKVTADQTSTLLDDAARLEQATDALPTSALGATDIPTSPQDLLPSDLQSGLPSDLGTDTALPSKGAA